MKRIVKFRAIELGLTGCLALIATHSAWAQTALPQVTVQEPAATRAKKPKVRKVAHARREEKPLAATSPSPSAAPAGNAAGPSSASGAADTSVQAAASHANAVRDHILAPVGANVNTLGAQTIEALPQGANAPLEKDLLQTPGFSQDSAASGLFHLRNEHANVQFRLNGILLPDGVSGFAQILDSGLIGKVEVLTGALPAQYGLHTSGIVDITTKSGAFNNGGSIGVYGGSNGTVTPSLEYGGTLGDTQYFMLGRYVGSNLGIENPTSSLNAIHDHTDQGRFFGYASTTFSDGGRLSFMTGVDMRRYQIPNSPGQTPLFSLPGVNLDSSQINENQYERSVFNVAAYQNSAEALDYQISAFSRYSNLHFQPDMNGDLLYNGVASDVERTSFLNGLAGDAAMRLNDAHTLRFGTSLSGEQATAAMNSTVFPVDNNGNQTGGPFALPGDSTSKFGTLFSAYLQDEWKLTDQVTLNAGLRFDQMNAYVSANQLSPRLSLTYKPTASTTLHAGYARYFTPPELALSGPTNLALYTGTSQQPAVGQDDAVRPERSNVYDIGIDQMLMPGLTVGVDAYFKQATDLLDDGQFGQALTLTAFNYAKGINRGLEAKINYEVENWKFYGNIAWGTQKATNIVSNQYLFDPDELAYISNHAIFTDHAQLFTGSAGASYRWDGYTLSTDAIFGSGLRNGFANLSTVSPYVQVNAGLSKEIKWNAALKPATLRFDVVNVFDRSYEIRDGSGIGVFAPQYGARRGFFVGFSQAF